MWPWNGKEVQLKQEYTQQQQKQWSFPSCWSIGGPDQVVPTALGRKLIAGSLWQTTELKQVSEEDKQKSKLFYRKNPIVEEWACFGSRSKSRTVSYLSWESNFLLQTELPIVFVSICKVHCNQYILNKCWAEWTVHVEYFHAAKENEHPCWEDSLPKLSLLHNE